MTTKNNEDRIVTQEVLTGDSVGDFFFWLGPDGFTSVNREQFVGMVEKHKAEFDENVSVSN